MDPRDLRQVGRYKVRRFISEGGMAWVFEVEDPTFEGRRLALKMLKPEAAAGEQFRRFEAEASLLAGIDHPNLVTIFDFGRDEDSGCYFFTMTLVDGPSLGDKGVLSLDDAMPFFLEVLAGLATLHDRRIVHRDIKPANILTFSDGRAVLADLGIARVETQSSDLTKTLMAIGTIKYMAPEQARGHPVSPASDVLSMGLTIYQTLTGRSVYDSVDGIDSASGQSILFYLGSMSGQAGSQLPMVFPDHVPRSIRRVLLKACRFAAADRYQNAREMRDALREAYEKAREQPTPGFQVSPALLAASLAAVFIAVGAWWYTSRIVDQSSAEDALLALTELRQSSADLIDQMTALSPPADGDLLKAARERISHAGIFVARGKTKLEVGNVDGATDLFQDAVTYYRNACQELLDGDLTARGDAAAADAQARVNEIATPEAQQIRPEAFVKLLGGVDGLAPPAEGTGPCAAGAAQLARLAVSGELSTQASLVERDLEAEWPRLAARAQAAAEAARDQASRLESSEAAYQEPMEEGRRALAEGSAARERGEFLASRRSFNDAREAFTTASNLAAAAHARERVRTYLEQATAANFRDQGVVESSVAEADDHYENERWDEAAAGYDALAKLLESLLADRQKAAGALAAADASEALRSSAIREGAASSAAKALAAADAVRSEARTALEAMRYSDAENGFGQAKSLYAQAQRASAARLAEARVAGENARKAAADVLTGGSCEALDGSAQVPCEAARESLRLGERALEDKDAGAAEQSFGHAVDRFAATAEAQRDFLAKRQQPPYVVSRTPEDERVRSYRNSAVSFEIEARDPNAGDPLHYMWTVDGDATGSNQPRFTYRGDRDAVVGVTVEDGRGGKVEETWRLSFTNRNPTLSLSPSARNVELEVGERRSFSAKGTDPDGESIDYSFTLDGQRVATGSRYTFDAKSPGRHELVARAIDSGGASARASVTIVVKPKPTPAPPGTSLSASDVTTRRTPASTPKPATQATDPARTQPSAPSKPPTQTAALPPTAKPPIVTKPPPKASGGDPEKAGVAALREYEAAYEARDLDRLSGVWIMNRSQRKNMASLFSNVDTLSVDLKIRTVYVENESVYIDFDQTISGKGKARLQGKPARMTATVIPRSGGAWVISSILPRS